MENFTETVAWSVLSSTHICTSRVKCSKYLGSIHRSGLHSHCCISFFLHCIYTLLYGKYCRSGNIRVIKLSCENVHGVKFSWAYPKLSTDFENMCCKYEEQFRLNPCEVYPAYIDMAVEYILNRL